MELGAACATAATCAVDETCTAGHCTGHTHDPEALAPGALDAVAAQFTARGFNLHIIRGHARPHSHVASFRTPTAGCEGADVAPGTLGAYAVNFYDVKNAAEHPFDHAYDRIYHYVLFAHNSGCDSEEHCESCIPSFLGSPDVFGQTGYAEISGNDFMVSLATLVGEVTCLDDKRFIVGGTFMHELGHNLGLRHGGGVDHVRLAGVSRLALMPLAREAEGFRETGQVVIRAVLAHLPFQAAIQLFDRVF